MTQQEYILIRLQIAHLKDLIEQGYGGHTIENIIQQLEARKTEAEKKGGVGNG